jgi:epoxyqueuosine reductase QueG
MAAVRAKGQVAVGSAQWIGVEREQITQFCDQEAEDFAFSARNEVEWLNEHMAEIFNNSQLYEMTTSAICILLNPSRNVTEIFKTPGKLRGKTPRTARKRNPLETRAVCPPPPPGTHNF